MPEGDFKGAKRLAQKMGAVLSDVDNVGEGADAMAFLLAFYLCRLRDEDVISQQDSVDLAGIVYSDVLAMLEKQPFPRGKAVH